MFIGLSGHADLRDNGSDTRRVGGQQMNAGQLIGGAAAEGFAVDGQGIAQVRTAGRDPTGQRLLEGGDIEASEEVGESGLAGGLAGAEAEGMSEGLAMLASELGDGFEGAHAGEHGNGEEVEQGGQGVLFTAWITRVGECSEQFGQGQRGIHAKGPQYKKTPESLVTEAGQFAQIKLVNNPAYSLESA